MAWVFWLLVALAFFFGAWRIFSSRPENQTDEDELEREHDEGILDDAQYAKRKAALPH